MFTTIEDDKPETEPPISQYMAFKSGGMTFAGYYLGEKKASPFSMSGIQAPVMIITEWMPIRLWQ